MESWAELILEDRFRMGIRDILKRHKWIVIVIAVALVVFLLMQMMGGNRTVIISGMLLNHDPGVSEDTTSEVEMAFLADLQIEDKAADVVLLTDWNYVADDEEKADDNYYTIQALTMYTQESVLDFVTGDQQNMLQLAYGDFFVDLSAVLSAEQMQCYAPYLRYIDMAVIEEARELDNEDMMAIINGEMTEFPDCTKPEQMEKPTPVFIDISECSKITAFYSENNESLLFAVMQNAPEPDAVPQWLDFIMGQE